MHPPAVLQGVLATWFFCPPDRLAALDMWLRTNTKASSFAAAQSLSGDEWRALEAAAAGLGLLRREQRAGQPKRWRPKLMSLWL